MRSRYRSSFVRTVRQVVIAVFVATGLFVGGYLTGAMSAEDPSSMRSVRIDAALSELGGALAAIDQENLGIASSHLSAARGLVAGGADGDLSLLRIASEISDARADLNDGHAERARERVLLIALSLGAESGRASE